MERAFGGRRRASHGPRSDFAADHARSALVAAWRLRSAVARTPHAAAHASCGRCGASHARVRGCAVVARARVVLARVEDDGRPRLPLPRGAPGRPVAAPRGRAVRHLANDRRRGLTGVDYSGTRGLDRAGPVPAAGCVPPQWSVVAGGGRATLALRRIRRSAIVRTIARTRAGLGFVRVRLVPRQCDAVLRASAGESPPRPPARASLPCTAPLPPQQQTSVVLVSNAVGRRPIERIGPELGLAAASARHGPARCGTGCMGGVGPRTWGPWGSAA